MVKHTPHSGDQQMPAGFRKVTELFGGRTMFALLGGLAGILGIPMIAEIPAEVVHHTQTLWGAIAGVIGFGLQIRKGLSKK